jgi:LmbE family N-acetylglucosaminyl deacetylase
MSDERPIKSVLVVTAHPDDVDFGAAGTIANWTDAGVDVRYCIVTNGDAGGFDPATPRREIAGIRQREQTAAAAAVGVHDLRFLGHPDGYLEATLQLRKDIAREIRRTQPDVVLCQSAERNLARIFASHPDHLAAGAATLCAVYPDARNPFWMPELLEEGFPEHTAWQVWIMAGPTTNRTVDITKQMDRKIAALRCHASQMPDPDGMEQRVRAWNGENARNGDLGTDAYAEIFQVIETG